MKFWRWRGIDTKAFKEDLRKLRIVVIMLLRDRMDISWVRKRKTLIAKLVISVLTFVIATYAIQFAMSMTIMLQILSLPPDTTLKPQVMVLIFCVLFIIQLITSTIGITKTLYFAHDNKILLTFPIKSNLTLAAKLITYYIVELKRNFVFLVPAFLAFGGVNGYGFGYYIVVILAFIVISLLLTVLGAVLSIPAMYIGNVLKQVAVLQYIIYSALCAAAVWVIFRLIMAIPAELNIIRNFGRYYNNIQKFLYNFEKASFPLNKISDMVTTADHLSAFITFSILFGIIVLGILIVWFVSRPLYFKMATKQFEHRQTRVLRPRRNLKTKPFVASFVKELRITVRTPKAFFADFAWLFSLPFAVLLLNKLFSAMSTRTLGNNIALAANVLIMLLILLNSSTSAASAFSKEGSSMALLKSRPTQLSIAIYSKVFLNYVFSLVSLAITIIIFKHFSNIAPQAAFWVFILVASLYTSHILWSLDMDVLNPQYSKYYNGEHEGFDPNELKSSLFAFVISFICFCFIMLILYKEKAVIPTFRDLAIASLLFVALRGVLNALRVKLLSTEETK